MCWKSLKMRSTVGRKWPSQAICCQAGHPLRPVQRLRSEWISHCHPGSPCGAPQTWVSFHAVQFPWCLAGALSFLTSYPSREEDRPKSEGVFVYLFVPAYEIPNMLPLTLSADFFFLKHECGGKWRLFSHMGCTKYRLY